MTSPHISALHVYPVKSCRGIALQEARLDAAGIEDDRRWMIVRPDGRFITQRELPALARIETATDADGLTLRTAGQSPLRVARRHDGDRREVRVWQDGCSALDCGDDAAAWLGDALAAAVRLVQFAPEVERLSVAEWAGGLRVPNRFSDGFPLLVLSDASLADLNARLATPLPVNRFRPNIVVGGVAAYDEDRMHEFGGDGWRLRILKGCTRCKITTVDQATGMETGAEPLRTLKSYRWSQALGGIVFAQNAAIVAGVGATLRVGEAFTVEWR